MSGLKNGPWGLVSPYSDELEFVLYASFQVPRGTINRGTHKGLARIVKNNLLIRSNTFNKFIKLI